jgi:hypothetical protein
MARVAWVFNGYSWPVNPEPDGDSGWVKESVHTEQNPLNASVSSFQFTAEKSARRQVTGWIIGPYAGEQLGRFQAWRSGRTRANLIDHMGVSKRCMLISFSAKTVNNQAEWRQGRSTYKYSAEFVEVQ